MVVDGLFAEADIQSLYQFLRDLPYQLNDVASDETSYVKHWKADFPPALAEGTPVLRECIRTARALMVGDHYRLDRSYTNMILYGDFQGPHTDPPHGITALYYAEPRVEGELAGRDDLLRRGAPAGARGRCQAGPPRRLPRRHPASRRRPVARMLRAEAVGRLHVRSTLRVVSGRDPGSGIRDQGSGIRDPGVGSWPFVVVTSRDTRPGRSARSRSYRGSRAR